MIDTDELRRWAKDECEYEALTRGESDWVQDATDEIDALRAQLHGAQRVFAKALTELSEARAEIAELQRHVEVLQDYRLAAKKMIDELTKERDEARRWAREFYRLVKWYQSATDRTTEALRQMVAESRE